MKRTISEDVTVPASAGDARGDAEAVMPAEGVPAAHR